MPVDILTRAEKGSNLTPNEADNDLLLLQNFSNALEDGSGLYVATSGTNTYTATVAPVPTNGTEIRVKIGTTSTGASTFNGKKIYKGVALQAVSGDLVAGIMYLFVYDTTLDTGTGGWYAMPVFNNGIVASDFATLAFAGTISMDCLNRQYLYFKSTVTANFTLAPANVKSAAQVVYKILTNTVSTVVITLDATTYTYSTDNSVVTNITLPAGTGKTYYLYFIADGTNIEIAVSPAGNLTGDVTSNSSGVTTIGANKVLLTMLATLATGKMIGNLSGSTATPYAVDAVDQIISNSTIQTALNTESGWSNETKTVSGIVAPNIWSGTNLTSSQKYLYICVVDGTAIRLPIGEAVAYDTVPVKTPTTTKSANYAMTNADHCIGVTANATITLPDPTACNGQEFVVICSSTSITVAFTGTVNGSTPTSLTTQYSFLRIKSVNNVFINIS